MTEPMTDERLKELEAVCSEANDDEPGLVYDLEEEIRRLREENERLRKYVVEANALANALMIKQIKESAQALGRKIRAFLEEKKNDDTNSKYAVAELKKTKPKFKSDGCTGFPDGYWRHCCTIHDVDYKKGGSWKERLLSDAHLAECVWHAILSQRWYWWWLAPLLPPFMFLGVRIFGSPWCLPLYLWPHWREHAVWGFGKGR